MKKKIKEVENNLNKQSNFKVYELILFAVVIILSTVFLTIVIYTTIADRNSSSINHSNKATLNEFEEVYKVIKDSYYKDVDESKMIEGAIDGMLSSLGDVHTSYFTKEETDAFNESMQGSYEGIGAELMLNEKGEVIILSVFKNSPAKEKGLKLNDIIVEVNGTSTIGKNPTEVVTLIKGNEKKDVNIKILRNGKELEFVLTKRIVEIDSVESNLYKSNNRRIGYLKINTFADNTYSQFKEELEILESKNINNLIIDVRDNSGGYLSSVTEILELFMQKGQTLYQIADKKNVLKYECQSSEYRNYPVIILTNGSSASASEILAISFKEIYVDAKVVGTTTYGKGTVQITKPLSNGGMIKYTIQKWLSPNGNWINEKGIEPDIKIDLSKEYYNNPSDENDNQLQKAIDILSKK